MGAVSGLLEYFAHRSRRFGLARVELAFGQRPVVISRTVNDCHFDPDMLFARALIGVMLFARALIGVMLFARALIGVMLFARALIGSPAADRSPQYSAGSENGFGHQGCRCRSISETWWSRTEWPSCGAAVHCPSGPSSQQRVDGSSADSKMSLS